MRSSSPRKRQRLARRLELADTAVAATAAPPWESLFSSLGDAVIVLDSAGRITILNPAAEQLIGRPQAQVLGWTCAELFPAMPAVAEMVSKTYTTGQTQARTEEPRLRGSRPIPLRLQTSAIWDHRGGGIGGTVLTIHDLSYQRTLEEDARRTERLAHLGTLVAGLAHEVKNPLGGIKGAAQLLALKLGDRPEVNEYTDVIVREANRLSRLVDELLMAGAPRPPALAPLNIHKVIQDVIDVVQPELSVSGIVLRTEFDPSLPDTRGDAAQLTQVLLNVIKNAIEAMRGTPSANGHRLGIVTRMETDFHLVRRGDGSGKFLRLEIVDTGPGLNSSSSERLFEPFYTTKPRGTGLGLAICQRIISAHGGAIRLENRANGGAVSTINLPLAG